MIFVLEFIDQRHRLVHSHPAVCHPASDGGQLRAAGRHPEGRRRVQVDPAVLPVPDRAGGGGDHRGRSQWGGGQSGERLVPSLAFNSTFTFCGIEIFLFGFNFC